MPFFEGSSNVNITTSEMNDVAGNLNKNTTNNTTNNTDSFNTNIGSKINKGPRVSQNMNIGMRFKLLDLALIWCLFVALTGSPNNNKIRR